MKKLIIPIACAAIGVVSGAVAGKFVPVSELPDEAEQEEELALPAESKQATEQATEYAKLNNQFVVPVVSDGRMAAMVVLSLSIEVPQGNKDQIFAIEPRLRDAFLSAMIDHANWGGFDAEFTSTDNMERLRTILNQAATRVGGSLAKDVLILDIVRQDL